MHVAESRTGKILFLANAAHERNVIERLDGRSAATYCVILLLRHKSWTSASSLPSLEGRVTSANAIPPQFPG